MPGTKPETSPRPKRFFVSGGTLPTDSGCYVKRGADEELFASLTCGDFCYVLNTRQLGKSSLKVRTADRLREAGVAVVDLDLTHIGLPATSEQWYYGMLLEIGSQLSLTAPLRDFWREHREQVAPFQRWQMAMREIVLGSVLGQLVFFIDEIDNVRSLSFPTDEFFAGIRECYNRRALDPEYARWTFCLLGVASPADLISDSQTTPFNIGTRIELNDFTRQEASHLADGLHASSRSNAMELYDRIFFWTNGHPYLTQRLCRAVAEIPESQTKTASAIDQICEQLFFAPEARHNDDNLAFVGNRLTRGARDLAALLGLYSKVLQGRNVGDPVTISLVTELRLAGVVRVESGRLYVRNRIYARVFDRVWVRENLPDAEIRRQREAYRKGIARATAFYATVSLVICALAIVAMKLKGQADRNASLLRKEAARTLEQTVNAQRQLYYANMAAAPRDWQAGHLAHLKQLLEETSKNENRGWEWGYWHHLCNLEVARIPLYQAVLSVGISPDGLRLALPGKHGVELCDAMSGSIVRSLGELESDSVITTAYSPDGDRIAAGGANGGIWVWDVATGRQVLAIRATGSPIQVLRYSDDGLLIVSSDYFYRNVRIRDSKTGLDLLRSGLAPDDHGYVSNDGRHMIVLGHDGIARTIALAHWKVEHSWPANDTDFGRVALSPDGRRLATWGFGVNLRILDADTGRTTRLIAHKSSPEVVAFSKDGSHLITACKDGSTTIWDAVSGDDLVTLRIDPPANFAAFFPDGGHVVTLGDESFVKVWSARNERRLVSFHAQREFVIGLGFSPDGKRIVTGGADSVARVWDVATGSKLFELAGHTSDVYAAAFSPDGKKILTGSNDATAIVWDAYSGLALNTLHGRGGRVDSVAWSPDGRSVATGHHDGAARIWDSADWKMSRTIRGRAVRVMSLAFLTDGSQLVTAGPDLEAKGAMDITNISNGYCKWSATCPQWLWSVAATPDGSKVACGCQDNTIRVFDARNGREQPFLQGHTDNVHAVAISPDGRRILSGSHDGTVRIWDTNTGHETLLLQCPHEVYAVAWSPDGQHIAAGGRDGIVRIWSNQ